MNADLAQELLNELGSSLEEIEKQQAALLQLLKDREVVTDDQLAPYLTTAGHASSVRWRAARVRLEYLFSAERSKEEKREEKERRNEGAQAQAQHSGKQAAAENEEDSGYAAPQSDAAAANAAPNSGNAPSAPESENRA